MGTDEIKMCIRDRCMEFPVMGEYHENLTLEEALRIYETIMHFYESVH